MHLRKQPRLQLSKPEILGFSFKPARLKVNFVPCWERLDWMAHGGKPRRPKDASQP